MIGHLHTRLRLAPGSGEQQARLKRLLAQMVDQALEPALQRWGIAERGELCIRRVVAPVLRLNLAASDGALIEQWAQSWAKAIARRLGGPDADVLHYGSRAHALIDLVVSATAGDCSRAWAWRRLGLWPAESAVTAGDAAGLVMRALTAHPAAAAAALARLAEAPALFERWLHQAGGGPLQALALALLRASGGAPEALEAVDDGAADSNLLATQTRLLGRSVIARAIALLPRQAGLAGLAALHGPTAAPRQASPLGIAQGTALALLVVAEAEPAWLRAPAAGLGALLKAIARGWADAELPVARAALDAPSQTSDPPPTTGVAWAGDAQTGDAQAGAGRLGRPLWRDTPALAGRPRPAADPAPPAQPASALGLQQPRPGIGAADPAAITAASPLPDLRRCGRTGHGGLLFLLNLAGDLGWPEALLQHCAPRGARSPRWCLHQLALVLQPLGASDPAALAFAGLLPGEPAPDTDQPPPSAAEAALIAQLRDDLVHALRARCCVDPPEASPDRAQLLASVCQRPAQIVADPGWLEVHFSLADVNTTLRAAGLDLDPGWLPWLGLVVKFIYD